MPSYPLRALSLRKTKLGEADLIVTLLAADGSQVRAVAKGARKPKSRFGARLEPYSVVDLLLHTGRTLEIVAEAETVASHDAIRGDLDRGSAAAVVADVLDKISVEGQTEARLFDMAVVTLDVLETAPAGSLAAVVTAFLLKALSMHGYRPVLDGCASCGGEARGAAPFSVRAGGLLCDACAAADPSTVRVSQAASGLMRALVRSRMAEVPAMDAPDAIVREALRVTAAHTAHHVPTRLKALEAFLREG